MLVTPRDLIVFDAIQKHGPLPSHYLFEFTKHACKDSLGFRKRLLQLTRDGYLDRPEQLNHPLIFTDFKVYVLTEESRSVLKSAGRINLFATPVSGGYLHALMTACITANIELGTTRSGYRYISQEEILTRQSCPQQTRLMEKPLSLKTSITHTFERVGKTPFLGRSERATEPDQLFGIDYGGGYRFFALEADRGTEPLTRPDLNQNSTLRKLLAYKDIIARRSYMSQWGIPNLFPLFVTTAIERADNMVALAQSIFPDGSNVLLFKAIPGFRAYLRTPPLLPALFSDPYLRVGEPFWMSKA